MVIPGQIASFPGHLDKVFNSWTIQEKSGLLATMYITYSTYKAYLRITHEHIQLTHHIHSKQHKCTVCTANTEHTYTAKSYSQHSMCSIYTQYVCCSRYVDCVSTMWYVCTALSVYNVHTTIRVVTTTYPIHTIHTFIRSFDTHPTLSDIPYTL